MKLPRYDVTKIDAQPLFLQRAIDNDNENEVRGVTGIVYKHDQAKLLKKKFKAQPTTQAEFRDCAAALEPAKLALVS